MPAIEHHIGDFAEKHRAILKTPYYLIDEARLLKNLQTAQYVRERSGAKLVLALKCFSTWAVFDLMRDYLDGTTSSSLYEARLGHDKFGKEVHAYNVAFSADDLDQVQPYATKIIFNSVSQLERWAPRVDGIPVGLRINPGISHSAFELADPARRCSRLGATELREIERVAHLVSGVMFHFNCENDDVEKLREMLEAISRKFEPLLQRVAWVSLGGGISFTRESYPIDALCDTLAEFARRFSVQVYLEPGEAMVSGSGFLIAQVLDIVHNDVAVAIVDAGTEPHMLDLLIYRMEARTEPPSAGRHAYQIAGRTCLAGDVFGTFTFAEKLEVGSLIAFADAAAYTMVKKNWFNGLTMPSIVVRRLDGRVEVVRTFGYEDYVSALS
jgi:carboxynorspermidine decarboxylase